MVNLLPNVSISKVAEAATSAGTTVTGTAVDMAGFDSVLFMADIATANAGNFLKVQGGEESDGSDAVDLAGTAVAAASNGEVVVGDVYRPKQRYVRPAIIRGGANTATGPIYAIRYNSKISPAASAIAAASKIIQSPAPGTP